MIFFVVCNLVFPHLKRMVVDEAKKYVLTNYEQVQRGGKAADSDHATEFMDLDLKVKTEKIKRLELWNFKDKEAQARFKVQTSETLVRKSFKKTRITSKKTNKSFPIEVSKFINLRNELLNKENSEKEIEDLNEIISKIEAETNRDKILKHF